MEVPVFKPTLKKGSTELLILSVLESAPLHGYQIGVQIETRSLGRLTYRVSSLYPVLCRMEERGWISGRWVEQPGQRRRRYYRLTKKGSIALATERETWRAFTQAVSLVTEPGHA